MMETKDIDISELIPDDKNFNKGTKKGQKLMDKSLGTFGAGRSIVLDKNNRIIAGNKTAATYEALGKRKVRVIETTGDELIAVKRTDIDLDSREGREFAMADNATAKANLQWDPVTIEDVVSVEDIEIEDWSVHMAPAKGLDNDTGEDEPDDDMKELLGYDDKLVFWNNLLGDYVYPTDNDLDIPLLLMDNQPAHLELPLSAWGATSRQKTGMATYHFYVDDYRFNAVFKNPIKILTSGCRSIVEPNCSIHDNLPVAIGIERIYRKRYLARYLQECGIQVWVDLNVAPKFQKYNILGVPKGYNAFFTRGTKGMLDALEVDLSVAQHISGRECPNLVVYGGGNEAKQFCQQHGLLFVSDFMTVKREEEILPR